MAERKLNDGEYRPARRRAGLRRPSAAPCRRLCVALGLLACAAEASAGGGRFELGAIETVEVVGERGSDWSAPLAARIDAEDLLRFERHDVAGAVNLLPGVTIHNVGGRSERLVFVRGFNSRQVPLFIDGIPVYVPFDGNVDLGRFTTFDVAEISVTKSLTSVLYGANTLGGSINLVSRRPSQRFEARAGAGVVADDAGDASRYRGWFNAGSKQGAWYVQAGGSWVDSGHFLLPEDYDATPAENGGRRNNSDATDFKLSLKAALTPNATDEYALSYYNQQGEKYTPPYAGDTPGVRPRFWRWPAWDKQSVYFLSRTALGEAHSVKLKAYYDKFDNTLRAFDDDSFTTQDRPFAFNSVFDDFTLGAGVELGSRWLKGHHLRVAFNYKRDVHREIDDDGLPQERFEDELMSVGIEDTVEVIDRWTFIAGLGFDRQEGIEANFFDSNAGALVPFPTDSETAVNVQFGTLYDIAEEARLHVSVARRTRFATIKDRYSFRLGSALPNPSLRPEEALHFELGIEGGWRMLDYGMNVFYSKLDDAIENVTISPALCARPPCLQLQNIGKQRNRGIELTGGLELGSAWQLYASYSYLERDNKTDPSIRPLDVPKHKLFSYARYVPSDRWELLATVEYNSSRFSSTEGDRIAGNFMIGSLKASFRPMPAVQLDAGVNNVADELYEYEEGFPEPGRTWFINAHLHY